LCFVIIASRTLRMVKLLSACVALLPLSAAVLPAPASSPFVVQGYLPATKAHKAYLSYRRGAAYVLDSAVITKGRFQLKGLVDSPQQVHVMLPPPGTSYTHMMQEDIATIYLEKGTITLTGTSQPMQAAATGTPLNRESAALSAQTAPIQARLTALYQARRRWAATERADTALGHRTDAQEVQLTKQLGAVYLTYLQAHPTNPFSLYALAAYEGDQPDAATYAPLFNALALSVRTSPHGQEVQQQIERLQRTALGALAPDFSLPDPSGKLVKLSDLRGQYVLVDFWASWCRPCRAENPTVAKAYAAYRDKNFTIVSISLDSPSARAAWLKAIQDDGLIWAQVSDLRGFNTEVAQQYAVSAIPQNFLLDPQGRIVAKNLRGEALPQKLAQVLQAN
jgi:peroxiredoxin